jgi:hypothetical protein
MAFDLASVTNEKRLRAPRIILLGTEKIGKSTFAADSNAPIIIPIRGEEGVDALDVPKFPTCNSTADLDSCFRSLYTEQHDYQTVVIDSASALEPLVWADVCQRHKCDNIEKVLGGFGKGFGQALDTWRGITEALDALRASKNIASILIGHVKIKRFDSPDAGSWDQYQFDVNDKAASLLFRWADAILFANSKVMVKSEDAGFNKQTRRGVDITGGARYLYTAKSPAYPAGGRGVYGRLPAELPLNFGSFMDAVEVASAK